MNKQITTILLDMLKTQSPWVYEHSLRVQGLSMTFAEAVGLPLEQRRELSTAAVLHDIGKLLVSKKILDKPGRLTAEEMSEMRAHTDYGYRTLNGFDYPNAVCEAVYQHHERCDGTGYHKIQYPSMLARIIQTADAYDAMTHVRPYAAGKTVEQVKCIFTEECGKQFWPELVDIVIARC